MKAKIFFIFILLPIIAYSQILGGGNYADPIPSTDRHLPFGIRSAGMGGVGVACSEDYTAVFYNPANLSYIYRFEVAGAIQYDALSFNSNFDNAASGEGSDSYIKLQNIGGVIPVPTTRGGLAVGLGFTRTNTFDHRLQFEGTGDDGILYSGDESVKGGLGKFSIGGGIQVSPHAALGMSLDFYGGGEKYNWYLDRQNSGGTEWPDSVERVIIQDDIRDSYSGIGARFGMQLVPNKYVQLGAYIATPTALYIEEDVCSRTDSLTTGWEFYTEDNYFQTFELILPWKFGGGVALRPTDWLLLAGDAEYVDWRQTEYDEPTWILDQNRLMDESFRATVRWSAGGELTIPLASLRLRGGFSQEPIPYIVTGENISRNTISGGVGILIGELTTLDIATQFNNWDSNGARLDEEYSLSRIWLGLSYRF